MNQGNHSMPPERSQPHNKRPAHDQKSLIVAELIIVLLIMVASFMGLLPLAGNETLFLLLFGWLSLGLRGKGWGAVGLKRPASWSRTLLLGVAVGVVCQTFVLLLPLIVSLTGEPLDLRRFAAIRGNAFLLLLSLAKVWTLTAFGEELAYRGYLMNRLAEAAGASGVRWPASLLTVSLLFGLGHLYQGTSGVVAAAMGGLVYGTLYLWTGHNLWVPIIAHGVFDTLAFVLIFWGRYPGM